MHHDLGDIHLGQVQHPAQHVAVAGFNQTFRMVVLHRAADFLVSSQDVHFHAQMNAEGPQGLAHDPLGTIGQGSEDLHHPDGGQGQEASHVIGPGNGQGFGQDFREDDDQYRHDRRGDQGPDGPGKDRCQGYCGQGRGPDIDDVVGQQDRPDHLFLIGNHAIDPLGRPVALPLKLVHPSAAGRGHGRLSRRDQAGYTQKGNQDRGEARQDSENAHGTAPSATRKAFRASGLTSRATKVSPRPRARMKVRRPPSAFLSWAMW